MFLSRIRLNTSLRKTMQALAAPNIIHGAIESAEKENRTRKLWRIDTLYGEKYLLVLSENKIDLSEVALQFNGHIEYECKVYDNLINRISNNSRWHFKLMANPTIQKYDAQKGRGKVVAHITQFYQEEWLKNQAAKNGFSLNEGEWLVTGSKWYTFKKRKDQKAQVRMLAVTYEGILTVTNSEQFINALLCGIGREKAYGLGMLTITGA